MSDKKPLKRCLSELKKDCEKSDTCVNNAGVAALTLVFQEDDIQNFESIIQTSLMSVYSMTKAVANHIRCQHLHGFIINIGSVKGDVFPCKELPAYVVSKVAVMHMTKSLLTEISKHQIRINTINTPDWCSRTYWGPLINRIPNFGKI